MLVPQLCDEARDVTITARLVSENMATRNPRETYKQIHGRIFAIWDAYEDDDTLSDFTVRPATSLDPVLYPSRTSEPSVTV